MKRLGIALATVLVLGSVGHADDSPVVTMLKNRPATMFDIGFLSLQRAVDHEFRDDGYHSLVSHDDKDGTIRIWVFRKMDGRTREDFLKECPVIIKRIKESDNYWNHFVKYDQPIDEFVRTQIPKIIRYRYEEIGDGYQGTCKGSLLDDGFTIEEQHK